MFVIWDWGSGGEERVRDEGSLQKLSTKANFLSIKAGVLYLYSGVTTVFNGTVLNIDPLSPFQVVR